MSVSLLFYMFGSTKISEFSDIRKCLNTFMYQALAVLASKNAAEIRNTMKEMGLKPQKQVKE